MAASAIRAALALSVIFAPPALCNFNLKDNFVGKDFLTGFQWWTSADPTHGQVNYVNQQTALSKNLTYASDTSFVMRADAKSKVASGARGRDSIRITSRNSYTDAVIVLDLSHMPVGCATWPAFWTVTTGNWPVGGEIDILEGVNNGATNQATLHTAAGCTMPQQRQHTSQSLDCDSSGKKNDGCGTTFKNPKAYGKALNSVQGGWFVMKRTNQDGVHVYFWGRDDASVPGDVKSGAKTINPDASWGEPEALFPTTSCNWPKHFDAHNIIFDLTFCGDWAGAAFASSPGCSGNCVDFVNNNPAAFRDAYWEVNAVRVYTQ